PTDWDNRYTWTVRKAVSVQGLSTFEKRPVTVTFYPQKGRRPLFYLEDGKSRGRALRPRNLEHGTNNIQLGPIQIIEHPLALMLALNLDVDIGITGPSFPTFDECNGPFLDALNHHVRRTRRRVSHFTVKEPVALKFDAGYCILEPEVKGLWMDHQIDYPGFLGRQRVVVEITPDFFFFLARARTPSFRSVQETDEIIERSRAGTLPFPLGESNVLFADVNGLRNPRPVFEYNDHNYEFICHELIDVMAFLKIVESELHGRFCGRLTTLRFGHEQQIVAAREMVGERFLANPGIRWFD
ncbi:MAG: UDP-3-O-acyl-N-acetylglucosamine deacetylase, partial [Leptospiraceae bacterium]|nr:UDP-3-O-acyl-N-acetylglucosamine deacetylase [Leptospiraceae bacterium]